MSRLWPLPPSAVELPPAEEDLTLEGVMLVQPGEGRQGPFDVTVRDGSIGSIAPAAGAGEGRSVVPGLIDAHMHLPPANALNLTGLFALAYLAHGVTSIRDAGDGDGTSVAAARDGLAAGDFPGPRVFSCGPYIGGPPAQWRNTLLVIEPEDAAAAVARVKEAGHDSVKSYDDLSLESVKAVKRAAADHGLPVIGHVPGLLAYEDALIPNVQHFFGVPEPRTLSRDDLASRNADWQGVDDDRLQRIVEVSVEHGIANTPTLVVCESLGRLRDYDTARESAEAQLLPRLYRDVVWRPREGAAVYAHTHAAQLDRLDDALAKKQRLAQMLWEAGCTLNLGTDTQQPFTAPGLSLHAEMRLFAEAGVPPEAVWRMATTDTAAQLGHRELGRLEVGAPADLLVYDRDPTTGHRPLDGLELVVTHGKAYRHRDLQVALEKRQAAYTTAVTERLSVRAARRAMARLRR